MLVIRFFRVGKVNQPSFKIVVTDKRRPTRAGRFVEEVGFWNPVTKEKVLRQDRIKYWLSVGAKPSPTVFNLLISEKIIEGKKIPVHKKPKEKEAASAPAGATASQGGKPAPEPSVVPASVKTTAAKKAIQGKEKPALEEKKEEPPKEEKPPEKPVEEVKLKVEEKPAEKPVEETLKEDKSSSRPSSSEEGSGTEEKKSEETPQEEPLKEDKSSSLPSSSEEGSDKKE